MRIACPDCNAAYDVPPERVPPGRSVKCARCATTWVPVATVDAEPEIAPLPDRLTEVPPEPEPVVEVKKTPPPPPPRPAAMVMDEAPDPADPPPVLGVPDTPPAEPPPPEQPRRRAPVILAWLATILLLAAVGWAAFQYRDRVMHVWPPSERVYRAMGVR